jgi:hypothetical protein
LVCRVLRHRGYFGNCFTLYPQVIASKKHHRQPDKGKPTDSDWKKIYYRLM